jgi:hypothetical protein
MVEAMVCIDLMAEIRKLSFWKREKFWRELYEKRILDEIVEPINQTRRDTTRSQKGER